ncbi:MAG: hypothetical protein RL235_592 [Chlamydiota bacterium]|jgi:glucan phosphoethanolaminetransferase (alkaline phosphatase superfamily)
MMEPSPRWNRLYFGILFLALLALCASSVFSHVSGIGPSLFFFLYATGQATLEIALIIVIAHAIEAHLGRRSFLAFIGLTFVILMIHAIDTIINRIFDLSIWHALALVADENLANFFFLLDASGIPIWAWIMGLIVAMGLPLCGIALYKATERWTKPRPSHDWLVQGLLCIPIALFLWDLSASRMIHPDTYTSFIQSLPWKCTFLEPKSTLFNVSGTLKPAPIETEMQQVVTAERPLPNGKKPNIYLFVVESLRSDFLNEETAPHLTQWKKQTIQAHMTLSNANGSHLSWFSIFHAQFPMYWRRYQTQGWSMGSVPLQILKQWGYKIRLYCSAELGYYKMDELLFGKDRSLLDAYYPFQHKSPLSAADTDQMAIAAMLRDVRSSAALQQGQVYIVFLDATHFHYSWPANHAPKFTPFGGAFAYFTALHSSSSIEQIKNRYRNAIHFVDTLFGTFWENLPKRNEAIVAFTGDHGEEFFEHGHLLHCSHLTHEQINIPLMIRAGDNKVQVSHRLMTQMDIFPTILDAVSGKEFSFLEGQSRLRQDKQPYAVIARYNGARDPYEFCLHNGDHKCIARFHKAKDIFSETTLQIRSLKTCQDCVVNAKDAAKWVQGQFGSGLDKLFTQKSSTDRATQ